MLSKRGCNSNPAFGEEESPFAQNYNKRTKCDEYVENVRQPTPLYRNFHPTPFRGAHSLEKYVNKKIKRNKEKKQISQVNQQPQQLNAQNSFVFTVEDLQDILSKVLKEKESVIINQFEEVLEKRLQEQFSSFTTFTNDYFKSPNVPMELSYYA